MYNSNSCFLCGSKEFHIIHNGVRNNPLINVLKCDHCGLVRLSECVDDSYYVDADMRQNDIEKDLRQIRISAERDDQRRYEFIKELIRNKIYVDFGCGAGGVLNRACDVAEQVYGIELEQSMCDALNAEGISCFSNIDLALESIPDKADVVSMFHVLEHIPNPIELLDKIKRLMSPEGIILIEIPNADDALLSLYDNNAFSDFTYWESHIYLYNNLTFRKLMEKMGLNIRFLGQVQRYPLSNTLYWLSKGLPGGHKTWNMLSNDNLDREYEKALANLGIADTIFAIVEQQR